jgi:hypothetical protein
LMQCRRTRATARRRRPMLASRRRLRPTRTATHAMEFTDLRALNSFHFVQNSWSSWLFDQWAGRVV